MPKIIIKHQDEDDYHTLMRLANDNRYKGYPIENKLTFNFDSDPITLNWRDIYGKKISPAKIAKRDDILFASAGLSGIYYHIWKN